MKLVTLPNREEMLVRLLKVSDISHLRERFYPILLKNAGQQRVAHGIVMMLSLAIHDYAEGMPPFIVTQMYQLFPGFIDALAPDVEVAKEAKSFFQAAIEAGQIP